MQKSMDYVLTKRYLCNLLYVGKSEISFNIRLNNHQKDMSNTKATQSQPAFILGKKDITLSNMQSLL